MKKVLTKSIVALLFLLIFFANASEKSCILNFREGQLYLDYSLKKGSDFLGLYHTTQVQQPKNAWDLLAFEPMKKGRGSFKLSFLDGNVGFFELRRLPFGNLPQMVWIDSGDFFLGSPESESGRYFDEGPQHKVKIEKGFWMSCFEVTQKQYQSVMGVNPSRSSGLSNRPVESVSWFDAMEYCNRLNQKAENEEMLVPGYEYRLPTEAEWEYACRAGTRGAFSFGGDSSELNLHGWWAENSGASPFEVGLLKANKWGLYDMHGNVFEWCISEYEAYPDGEIRDLKIDYRVVRGGAFMCPDYVLRSACRFESAPSKSASWLTGFRVVLAPIFKVSIDLPTSR